MELFIDTETTGLPLYNSPATDPKQPDIIQIACILSDEKNIYASLNCLIDPTSVHEGWTMDPYAAAAHGISEEAIINFGVDTSHVMNLLHGFIEICDTIVMHNVTFDKALITNAFYKAHFPQHVHECIENTPFFCTMISTTELCGLKKKNGSPKWPKLEELYQHLFGETFEHGHSAMGDCKATRRCYYELKRRGVS